MRLFSALVIFSTFVFSLPGCVSAEEPIHVSNVEQGRVIRVATALNHVSIIQLPEPILSAAIGSEGIRMEWHDNRVLIQPLKEGIATNLFVWTSRTRTSYEILPAGDPALMSYLIDEVFPPPPPPAPGPSPEEVQRATDAMVSNILLGTRMIDHKTKLRKHHVNIQLDKITQDDQSYYVHLSVFNLTKRPYRISELRAESIHPTFSGTTPQKYLYHQISDDVLQGFGVYSVRSLQTHGSTLAMHDLLPGRNTNWVVAVTKPTKDPSILRFYFPMDSQESGKPPEVVHAVAIF